MKKLMTFSIALAFVLSLGTAYAGDYAKAMNEKAGNGITVFERGPAVFDIGPTLSPEESYEHGSAAGGMDLMESELGASNGVTLFSEGSAVFDIGPTALVISGVAAGGVSREEPLGLYNGITVFRTGTANYDIGPIE
jgi:hypothetical protein